MSGRKRSCSSEGQFTRARVVPLLQKLGFRRIKVTHGTDEYGRDVVFLRTSKLGPDHFYGAQIKYGDVSGKASNRIKEIVNQIDTALSQPYMEMASQRPYLLAGMYVIVSGKYTRNAKEILMNKINRGNVWFLDGDDWANLESQAAPSELQRLLREARATMRVDAADAKPLRVALEQIDLLKDSDWRDKADAIAELAQEIVLNSDAGTEALVEAIVFQVSTGRWYSEMEATHGTSPGEGESTYAGILWNMLVDAIEYGRSGDSCRNIIDAIDTVHQQAVTAGNVDAAGVCIQAVKASYPHATGNDCRNLKERMDDVLNSMATRKLRH